MRSRDLAACVLAIALAVTACGDDDDATAPATSTSAAADDAATSTTETTGPGGAPAADEPGAGVIEVTVQGGEVTGGGRHEVPLGERVVLRVTSDTADEVHLHGYDLYVDVVPGEPAELSFDAEIPGVFEAELHDSGIVLAELQIR